MRGKRLDSRHTLTIFFLLAKCAPVFPGTVSLRAVENLARSEPDCHTSPQFVGRNCAGHSSGQMDYLAASL